jgi:hypothetical protein
VWFNYAISFILNLVSKCQWTRWTKGPSSCQIDWHSGFFIQASK